MSEMVTLDWLLPLTNLFKQPISDLQVGPKTLLTRFGGIVGVGKNVLWILVFIFSSVGFLRDILKQYLQTEIIK